MKQSTATVQQFLDLEAQVDDEIEDEEIEDDLEEPFIDDSFDVEEENRRTPLSAFPEDIEGESEEDEEFWHNVLQRSKENARNNCWAPNTTSTSSILERFHAFEGDYPLWQVRCRIGSEENIVFTIWTLAKDEHELRSAFMRESIRGSVYLECTMNARLLELLRRVPGINRTFQGIQRHLLEPPDSLNVLKMRATTSVFTIGEWVKIKKGLYAGDVGRVHKINKSGAEIHLIPRVAYEKPAISKKRKFTPTRPPPRLFEFALFQKIWPKHTLKQIGDGSRTNGRVTFQRGVLKKTFTRRSIGEIVETIPYATWMNFRVSDHPDFTVETLPRPREWIFKEGDRVNVQVDGYEGELEAKFLQSLKYHAEVTLPDTQTVIVRWHCILKHFEIADEVEIIGGPHVGIKGWVEETYEERARVVYKTFEGDVQKNYKEAIKKVDVHLNFLTHAEKDFRFSQPTAHAPLPLKKATPQDSPWYGTEILIVKQHDALKGKQGVVKNVEIHGKKAADVKLLIQISNYDPSAPFPKIELGHDDVVEALSFQRLQVWKPLLCLEVEQQLAQVHMTKSSSELPTDDLDADMTPSHSITTTSTDSHALSPAWDPSSRTPSNPSSTMADLLTPFSPNPSHASSSNLMPSTSAIMSEGSEHLLLKDCLVDLKLVVLVNGENFNNKELTASITKTDGRLSIRHIKHRTSRLLQPAWVTPKNPNPAQDNGLLVVIKGEHAGKLVRRIYHKTGSTGPLIYLAVVTQNPGGPDSITDQRLELPPDHLCKVFETKDEKELNRNPMVPLRQAFNKHVKYS